MEKLEPSYIAGGNVKWCSCCRKVWQFLKQFNIELPYDPAILFLGICLKELKTDSNKYLYADVHSSIIHNGQKVETTQMSIDG